MANVTSIYRVELLSKTKIELDHDKILESLQRQFPNVESMNKSGDSESLMFAFPDYLVHMKDAVIPAQAVILSGENQSIKQESYVPALQQTWGWEEAKSIVPACTFGVMLSDFMSAGLPYHDRLELFNGILYSVLSVVHCDAIHWVESQKICNPAEFVTEQETSDPNPLIGALNVRFYNIQGSTRAEFLMDTMGLAAFGLPDVQCHFLQLEPGKIANFLFSLGHYLFDYGDVINDGETVEGLSVSDAWICQHEIGLARPEREVLDVNPGAPYAAGDRE